MQDKNYDKRVVKRNIKKGVFTSKDHEKYLKSLEDSAGNLEVLDVSDEDSSNTMPSTEDYKDQ